MAIQVDVSHFAWSSKDVEDTSLVEVDPCDGFTSGDSELA